MSRVEASILVRAAPDAVFAFHDDPRNLLKVLPPYLRVEIVDPPERLASGRVLSYRMFIGPLRFEWDAEIAAYEPPRRFTDVQKKGPFSSFVHEHVFEREGDGTRLIDVVDYELPLGPLGELANRVQIQARLVEVLEFGQAATRAALEKA